jgi:hypothetical protein
MVLEYHLVPLEVRVRTRVPVYKYNIISKTTCTCVRTRVPWYQWYHWYVMVRVYVRTYVRTYNVMYVRTRVRTMVLEYVHVYVLAS